MIPTNDYMPLFDSMSTAIVVLDSRLAVIFSNAAAEMLLESSGHRDNGQAMSELLREQMHDALATLSEREREVLALRFGLTDGESHTLEEVGAHFNVTRERVRQIEAKALLKLRHPTKSRKLREYLT